MTTPAWQIRPRHLRAGFSLMEVTAVLAGMSFLMILSALLLISTFRIKDTSTDALDRQGRRSVLADLFRDDVAGAVEAPERHGDLTAGNECLILRKPDGNHLAYRVVDGRLERWHRSAEDGTPLWMHLEPVGIAADFSRTGPDGRLITLRIAQMQGRGASKRPVAIAAALGGDLR
jgi:hypothetical protein